MEPTPQAVVERIVTLAEPPWPTREDERRDWFARHGMPAVSVAVPELDERAPRSTHFRTPSDAGWPETGWHRFEGEFVGVVWHLWWTESDADVAAAAGQVRDALDAAWGTGDHEHHPGQGIVSRWSHGLIEIQMYEYEARPLGQQTVPSSVQLHLDHAGRAASEEELARRRDPRSASRWSEAALMSERTNDRHGKKNGLPPKDQTMRVLSSGTSHRRLTAGAW